MSNSVRIDNGVCIIDIADVNAFYSGLDKFWE